MEDSNTYFQACSILEAQEMLRAMNVADYPYAKKDTRQKLHRQVHKQAFPDAKKRGMTFDDLKSILGKAE